MGHGNTRMNFKLPKSKAGLLQVTGSSEGNLEDEVMIWDFFRSDTGWAEDKPLVLCKDGGLLACFGMRGIDPESFDQEMFTNASQAIRRAMDSFGLDSLEESFRGGSWEIGNTLMRLEVRAPKLAKLERKSEVLGFLNQKTENFWNERALMDDELVWWIKFCPRMISKVSLWFLRAPSNIAEYQREIIQLQAQMVRRVAQGFVENMLAFSTPRPVQTVGIRWLDVESTYKALFTIINRGLLDPPEFDPLLSLNTQVCMTTRENYRNRRYYSINDQPTAVLTFKRPPQKTWGNHLAVFQERCSFPFFLTNTWEPVSPAKQLGLIGRNMAPAITLQAKNKMIQEWIEEADELKTAVEINSETRFNWRFTAVVSGKTTEELEQRVNRLRTWIKGVGGAEPLIEGAQSRHFAEMSSIPGSRYLDQRVNLVTSENAGDSALIYRLNTGSASPHLVFGNRRSGAFGYDLFSSELPNWNCAIIGGPGTGKSVLQNKFVHGIVGYPSQISVIDIGGSFGRTFEWLSKELKGSVTTMRFGAEDFTFNPLPMVWALKERDKQIAEGTYKMALGDGVVVPCPVQGAKVFFEHFLEVLLSGDNRSFSPETRNRLDKALYGAENSGDGGFFRHYEKLCRRKNEFEAEGREMGLPEPLSQLLIFVKTEVPELTDSLELWVRGDKKRFFDTGKDAFSDAKAVYFELSGLDENKAVAPPFVAALMGAVWRKVIDPTKLREKKLVIFDEAWAFLGDPAFAPIIEMVSRTIRKFNGALILGTQTPDEIKKGDGIKLLRTMSHVFLYKGFNDQDFFSTHLQMTPNQIELYLDLQMNDQVREVFHWEQSGKTQILDVKLDPWRYWLITSEAGDKDFWARMLRKNEGDERATIEELAKATNYRTIPSKELRHRLISQYMIENNIK